LFTAGLSTRPLPYCQRNASDYATCAFAVLAQFCLINHSSVAPTHEATFRGSAAFREESHGMSCKVFPYTETCRLESSVKTGGDTLACLKDVRPHAFSPLSKPQLQVDEQAADTRSSLPSPTNPDLKSLHTSPHLPEFHISLCSWFLQVG